MVTVARAVAVLSAIAVTALFISVREVAGLADCPPVAEKTTVFAVPFCVLRSTFSVLPVLLRESPAEEIVA